MFFLIDKIDNRTRMVSDNIIEHNNKRFDLIKINVNKKDEEDIKTGKYKAEIDIKTKKIKLKDFNN